MSDAPAGPRPVSTLKRCDLHLHTRFSSWRHARVLRARDSYSDPVEVFERAKAAGMDYVAITDHDSIEGALRLLEARPERSPEIIVGEEVETLLPDTGQRLHVNVFGLDEAAHREVQRLRRDVRDLVAFLRHRGLLHVLNHPFWSYRFQKRPRAYVEEILDLFDHFEAGNSTMPAGHAEAAGAMLRYAAALGLRKTAVAGSDAHVPDHVASSFTLAPGDTAAAWLTSVKRGECTYLPERDQAARRPRADPAQPGAQRRRRGTGTDRGHGLKSPRKAGGGPESSIMSSRRTKWLRFTDRHAAGLADAVSPRPRFPEIRCLCAD